MEDFNLNKICYRMAVDEKVQKAGLTREKQAKNRKLSHTHS